MSSNEMMSWKSNCKSCWIRGISDQAHLLGAIPLSLWRRRTRHCDRVSIVDHSMQWQSRTGTHCHASTSCSINWQVLRCSPRLIFNQVIIKSRFVKKIFWRWLSLPDTVFMNIWLCLLNWLMPPLTSCTWWTLYSWWNWTSLSWFSMTTLWSIPRMLKGMRAIFALCFNDCEIINSMQNLANVSSG
jgi:hypothetical protein